MLDKKPTDNEIIKALEEYSAKYNMTHNGKQAKAILDLINRQQAEIERLKNQVICIGNECDAYKDILETSVTEAKAEAYKECIEKVKELFPKEDWFTREALDNLLKELVVKNKIV